MKMPLAAVSNSKPSTVDSTEPKTYRPPKEVLDIFWTLADGTDEQRVLGTVKLSKLLKASKDEEKEKIVKYCRERLVKGLSSGRKFARIGFSVTLSELLRKHHFQASDVIAAIHEKLKLHGQEKSSKSEVGGIYLGRAFGFSSIIQSGALSEVEGDALSKMVDELLSFADKKSYLKAVSSKTVEDIVSQISTDVFAEHVWPKLRDKMKQGWDSCTLDTLSLLLVCRAKFPDVVNKKFLKKHWGYPVLGEENDSKLLKATLDTVQQKSEILLEKIIPLAQAEERDVASLWSGLGEKLMGSQADKRTDGLSARQTLGLKLASKLLSEASAQEALDLTLSDQVIRFVFHSVTRKDDPLAAAADLVFKQLSEKIRPNHNTETRESNSATSVLDIVQRVWKLESEVAGHQSGKGVGPKVDFINSSNFTQLLDLMDKDDAENYAEILMAMVKGKDEWEVMSDHPNRRTYQVEVCLRQLQHLVTSSLAASAAVQTKALSLFLRLAFFRVDKKVKALQHCETSVNFEEDNATRKLCESLLFKSLNTISTMNAGHQRRKSERESSFVGLLCGLCQYIQELLASEKVAVIKTWSEEMQSDWEKLNQSVTQLKQGTADTTASPGPAFLLLFLHLGLQMLADYKTVSEMLQDVYVCYEKAISNKKSKKEIDSSDEPSWVEVLTEVLLHLMSLPSHLGRIVTATVFRMLTNHMTPKAIGLVTEVLIPKKSRGDDAGGAMVEAEQDDDDDDENGNDEEEDDSDSVEGDDEGGEDDDADDENADDNDVDMDDEEEENVEVDEQFRESVRQALGDAADVGDSEDEEKEMSDLSDSEMFKLDNMLAEVFRQRQKAGAGKKARQEKRAELANFRLRVLDLVENMIKSDRCGDFLLDFVKPLLLLTLRSSTTESLALNSRAQALFSLLRSKAKALRDTVHTPEEQRAFFQELLELAQKTSDPTHMQAVSVATYIVMNITCEKREDASDISGCMELFQETLTKVIEKRQAKPHLSFFTAIIEMNPILFQSFSNPLLANLQDDTVKVYNKTLCCAFLTSLCKKVDIQPENKAISSMNKWMTEAAAVTAQIIFSTERDSIKSMLLKEVLQLMLAIQARKDVLQEGPFDVAVKQKLTELKSKFNTDLKRLANKVIAGIDRSQKLKEGTKGEKKRKHSESDTEKPKKKKSKQKA